MHTTIATRSGAVVAALTLISSAALAQSPPPRFLFSPSFSGAAHGSVTSTATAGAAPATSISATNPFSQTIPMGSGGGNVTGSGGIGAFVEIPMNTGDCSFEALAQGQTQLSFRGTAGSTALSFSSSSRDRGINLIGAGGVVPGGPFGPWLGVVANTFQRIDAPLVIEFPFDIASPCSVVLSQFVMSRTQSSTGAQSSSAGWTTGIVRVWHDNNMDGIPDAGAVAFGADLTVLNNQHASLPASTGALPAGHYIAIFTCERQTLDGVAANVCSTSASDNATTSDMVNVRLTLAP